MGGGRSLVVEHGFLLKLFQHPEIPSHITAATKPGEVKNLGPHLEVDDDMEGVDEAKHEGLVFFGYLFFWGVFFPKLKVEKFAN